MGASLVTLGRNSDALETLPSEASRPFFIIMSLQLGVIRQLPLSSSQLLTEGLFLYWLSNEPRVDVRPVIRLDFIHTSEPLSLGGEARVFTTKPGAQGFVQNIQVLYLCSQRMVKASESQLLHQWFATMFGFHCAILGGSV